MVRGTDAAGVEHEIDLAQPWPVVAVDDALSKALGRPVSADTDRDTLVALARSRQIAVESTWTRGAVLLELYEHLVEHVTVRPTFYIDFPAEVSPLTRPHRVDPRLAERWDLVAFGAEIGTAYSELVDPVEQRRRLQAQSLQAAGGDAEAMELDEDFLLALEHAMPPSGGLGMGMDRAGDDVDRCLHPGDHRLSVGPAPGRRRRRDGGTPVSRWSALLRRWVGELRAGHLWPGLSVLTLVSYNTWVLWRPVNGHRAIFNGYLSEFSASDQPHSFFFRGGDLITAVIVLGLGLRALMAVEPSAASGGGGTGPDARTLVGAVASVFLLVFGVSTFLDAFFAMDCSPSLSERCRLAEEAGRLSWAHYTHTYTSVGAQTGIVASMVATFIAMCRSRQQPRGRRRFVLVVTVVEVVSLLVMMGMLVADAPGLGYPQAVMVLVASLWFGAIGFRLIGEEADSAHAVVSRPALPEAAGKPTEGRRVG